MYNISRISLEIVYSKTICKVQKSVTISVATAPANLDGFCDRIGLQQ